MNIAAQLQALFSVNGFINLMVLASLELVLGIDNIIFISLVVTKLPEGKRFSARIVGLGLALLMRCIMLFALVWLAQTTSVLFTIGSFAVTVRDVLFMAGGGYLLWSTSHELNATLKHQNRKDKKATPDHLSFRKAIAQIVLVDMLFSFDSIFTAIGLIQNLVIMILAVVLGMVFMVWLSGKISAFINKYPSIKILALSFIVAVGLLLVLSALHIEVSKKYIYIGFFAWFVYEMYRIFSKRSPS